MAAHPRIYFFGDVHGQFQHVLNIVQRDAPDAIILLGDLEPSRPLDVILGPILNKTIVRFIHGNHDTDSWPYYENVFRSPISTMNLHGRVEEICGIRIAGLGGVFRQRVWRPPTKPVYSSYEDFLEALNGSRPPRERKSSQSITSVQEREHVSSIFANTVQELAQQDADILVSHEAPSCHPNGFAAIDGMARAMGVRLAYHGHHHQQLAYRSHWRTLGFRAYGVGTRNVACLQLADLAPLASAA